MHFEQNKFDSADIILRKFEGVVAVNPGSRSHVLYNSASMKYILWGSTGPEGGYGVFVAASPTGLFQPAGYAALDPEWNHFLNGDNTVYQSGDKAWLAWSALNPLNPQEGNLWPVLYQTMHITPLRSDFVSKTWSPSRRQLSSFHSSTLRLSAIM